MKKNIENSQGRLSRFFAILLGMGIIIALTSPLQAQNQKAKKNAPAKNPPAAQAAPKAQPAPAAKEEAAEGENVSEMNPEMQAKYKEAVEKFSQSDIAGSLEILKEMAASAPKMIPPRLVLAQWFSKLQNQNAVRVSLEMATEENPEDPEAYNLLAEIALRQGELTAAELLITKTETLLGGEKLAQNPERQKNLTIKFLKNRVVLDQNRKRWEDMQKALGSLWKLEGETTETSRLIGVSYFHLDKMDLAKQWFDRAEKSDATELPANVMMARLYLADGNKEKAKEYLDAALKQTPESIPVLNLSLTLAINENDLNKVQTLSDHLYAAAPSDPATLKTCGIAALYLENYPQAEKLFQEAIRLEPANMEIANGLALALCEQGDPEKTKIALQHATSNIQKQNNNRDFVSTLGWVLYKSGDRDRALAVLQQSAADGQLNAQVAYYLAEILKDSEQKENAQKLVSAALGSPAPFAKRQAAERLANELK